MELNSAGKDVTRGLKPRHFPDIALEAEILKMGFQVLYSSIQQSLGNLP